MITNKLVTFIRRLFQLTLDGRVCWEETAREGVYQVALDEYVVRIQPNPRGAATAADPDYVLTICNGRGAVIEEIGSADLSDRMFEATHFMKDLYERARRVAMGVEAAVDRLLQALDRKDESSDV